MDLHLSSDTVGLLPDAQAIRQLQAARDTLEVMRQYAKSATDLEIRNRAARARLLLERRAGRLLTRLHLQGGNRKSAQRTKRLTLKELGVSHSQSARWQREASVPRETFQRYLRETVGQGREITSSGLLEIADSCHDAPQVSEEGRDVLRDVAFVLCRMAAEGRTFSCIYAAPKWPENGAGRNGLTVQYAELARSLARLPVRPVARTEAHLHLAVIPEALPEAMRVLAAWDFRYASSLVVASVPSDFGRYWRRAHELLLLGVRGHLPFLDNDLSSWADGSAQSNADRPHRIRRLLEQASPGPYLDLFGTVAASGWTPATLGAVQGAE